MSADADITMNNSRLLRNRCRYRNIFGDRMQQKSFNKLRKYFQPSHRMKCSI